MSNRQLDEEQIFHVARKIPNHDARTTYLDQICAGDQALRERVEALLDVHEQEQSFLKSNANLDPTAEHTPITESPGTKIGRFKLLQQIGEGGFGVVYMAEQQRPVRRKVALKIIKPGMDTSSVVARFDAERQALAMMDHPNIARILDGGATDSGRPYFVMELVKGVPITEYCDKNQLSTDERLHLFINVCKAVQHAHQKGIIHRDLKPSNILVTLHDGNPVIKVIDFGVAKAINQQLTEKTLFTAYGQMVGTPQYMSPEQAEMSGLDVDTRSDIYSLGVLLYELLTGTTPLVSEKLRTAGYVEMQRLIREEEPPKPSTRLSSSGELLTIIAKDRSLSPEQLQKTVRGDLDWIVMKALDKDRGRRYDTPSSLSDDVVRFSNNEPVEACPPSSGYRLRKLVRRNRGLIVTTAGLAGVLLAATVISSWFAWQWKITSGLAQENERHARRLAAKELIARTNAEESAAIAKEKEAEANRVLEQLQEELLIQAFNLAFTGELREVEDALEKAKKANAPDELMTTIQGIAHMCGGDADTAVSLLDDVLEDNRDNLAAVCAASWANMTASRYDDAGSLYKRIGLLAEKHQHTADDHTLLLLAMVKVYGTTELPNLVEDLDEILDRHPRWGVAYAIRAQAKAQYISQSEDGYKTASSAANDAFKANQHLPDNPFVLGVALEVYAAVIEFAKYLGKDTSQFERQADDYSSRLDNWQHYLQGRHRRLFYYYLMPDRTKYESEKKALVSRGWASPQPKLAEFLQLKNATSLTQLADQHASRAESKIALVVRKIVDGRESSALKDYADLEREIEAVNSRLIMFDIPMLAQEPDLVRDGAIRLLSELPIHNPKHYWRFEVTCVRYLADQINEEQLLGLAGPFRIEQSTAHYFIGMRKFADNDIETAKEHLSIAAKSSPVGWWFGEFSEAYINLIDQGRLPPPDGVEDSKGN